MFHLIIYSYIARRSAFWRLGVKHSASAFRFSQPGENSLLFSLPLLKNLIHKLPALLKTRCTSVSSMRVVGHCASLVKSTWCVVRFQRWFSSCWTINYMNSKALWSGGWWSMGDFLYNNIFGQIYYIFSRSQNVKNDFLLSFWLLTALP